MSKHHSPWGKQTRQRVALEAARIMSEEHLSDFSKAKRKAADRLGITARQDMPTNQEIEQELIAYRSMFSHDETHENLKRQRESALDAMQYLSRFKPRLVGRVLEGSAGLHETVELHLFSDLPDDIVFFLMDRGIEFEQGEERVRYKSGNKQDIPCIRFYAGDIPFKLMIFSAIDIRQAPLSNISGQPVKRADLESVKALLTAS